jgi:iron complex transport system substrate-binding protein
MKMKKILSIVLVMVLLASAVPLAITPAAAYEKKIPCGDGDNELTKEELVKAILPYMLGDRAYTLDDIGDAAYVYAYWGGKPKTVTDTVDKAVTMYRPLERIVAPHIHPVETLRTLKAKDKLVGVGDLIVKDNAFFPEFGEEFNVGSPWKPDVEAILSLHPDAVILHTTTKGVGEALDATQEALESAGITVLRLNFNQPDIYVEEVEKLACIIEKEEEAEEFIDWRENIVNTIEERVPSEGPNVYSEGNSPYTAYGGYTYIDFTGGKDLFSDAAGPIEAEAVIALNPDIIVKTVWYVGGYDSDYTSELEAIRDEIMSRLQGVSAVTNESVYIMCTHIYGAFPNSGCRHFLQLAYQAKWFHPELFPDTEFDPKAMHQEYLTRFQGLDIDLDKQGVFVYHPEKHPDGN